MINNNGSIPATSNYVITSLQSLSFYAKILSQYPYITQGQQEHFLVFARILGLDGKTELDTDILRKFGDLITGHSIDHYFSHGSIYDRLAKTWKYLLNVQDNDVPQVITGRSSASSSPPSLNLDRLQAATKNSSLMFKTVIERNQSINNILLLLDISTVLLIIIIRSQAHEYTLGNILRRIQTITKDQIDIADLLSVESKVPKAGSDKPDTRAIRDATAHARSVITNDSNDFTVHFNNTEDGYIFQKTYSRKELLNFYEDYDRVTNIVSRLLNVRLLFSFLNLHFTID